MGFDAAASALSFAGKLRKRASLTDQIESLALTLQERKEAEDAAAAAAAAAAASRRNTRRPSLGGGGGGGGGGGFGVRGWGTVRRAMEQGRRHSAAAMGQGASESVCSPDVGT